MKTKSFLICPLLLVSLALTTFLTIESVEGQLQWSTHFQIEVLSDGSAVWVVQQRTTLTTEDDEAAFFQYLNITSGVEISNHVHSMVSHASLVTGRSMRVESLEVNANITSEGLSKEGIIQYQFDWLGFGESIGEQKIKIGDALSGELDLSRNDQLTLKYPVGYAPIYVDPSPDETRQSERALTWLGPKNFGAGEPDVLLERKSFSWTDVVTGNIPLLAIIVASVSIGFLGYFLGVKRALGNQKSKPKVAAKQAPFSDFGVEDDEEKVMRLLIAAGGQVYQSTITKQCGFSKSKTSELLSVMERKGVISRKKVGRGKVVTVTQKQKTEK